MVNRIARWSAASIVSFAGLAAAQSPSALPPQNYGAQPGFFRSAPEMAAMAGANPGVIARPAVQPVAQAAPTVPVAAPVVAPEASTVVVAPPRIVDPTQNLQWTERQMDRSEAAAAQLRQQALAAPPPVAPGAYNGSTNPADR
jgi:hypothetical protein